MARTILRIGLWLLVSVVVLVAATGGLALYFFHKFNPDPPPNDFPKPSSALDAQRQDVEQFARLIAMDRAFSPAARQGADRRIAALRAEQAPLDRGQFRVALLEVAALADNGHTNLYSDEGGRQNYVPLRVTVFADGTYVLRAKAPYADILGARVERIDGHATADVLAALDELHGGTEADRRTFSAIWVQSPEILYGAEIGARPDRSTWILRLADGSEATRVLPGEPSPDSEPHDDTTRWLSPEKMPHESADWRSLLAVDAALPLSLRDFNKAFRREWVGGSCTLFLQLKSVTDVGDEHIGDFLRASEDEMRAHQPCNVILDLRFNGGGDYTNTADFAKRLPDLLSPGGHVYVLTSGQTFSAAITTTASVKQAAGARAVILGEPVGDRLTFWAEGNEGCLPHARLCFHYATGMHDYAHPCTDWDKCYWLNWFYPVRVKSLAPDETINMTFADYLAKRDPVFDRAVALAGARH